MISSIVLSIKSILKKILKAEIDDEFRLQQNLMKFLGIYKLPFQKRDYCSFGIKIIFLLIGFYGLGKFIIENLTSATELSQCLAPSLSMTMATIKFITFFFNSDQFFWIVSKIQMLNERSKNHEIHDKIIRNVRRIHSRLLIPIYCVILNVLLSAIVRPILQNLISLCFYGQMSLTMPLKMSYNNTSMPTLYVLVYCFQVILIFTVFSFNVSMLRTIFNDHLNLEIFIYF